MNINRDGGFKLSKILIAIGIALALWGKVRTGSILLAVGLSAFTFFRYQIIGMKRRIELFLPLGIAGVLLVVALTLPHAR